jgi:hypothetical protein
MKRPGQQRPVQERHSKQVRVQGSMMALELVQGSMMVLEPHSK